MFATVTSGEVQNTAFCNLLQLVAGLLQKQLCFAIGSNEKKRFFAHSHKREVQKYSALQLVACSYKK